MGFIAQSIADGQLATTKTTLYTVPALTTLYVKFFRCYNAGVTTESVKIYAKPGATSRVIGSVTLAPGETFIVIDKDDTLILGPASLIEGLTTTTTTVDFIITGVLET